MAKIISFIVSVIMFCFPALNIPHVKVDDTKFNTEYANVFVHGLAGWGSYTWYNDFLPYWGMFGGDLMQYLNARGFECYSASVDPTGSAWDRACELYAQLTGTVTDYGEEHSKRCRHDRYGEDYSSDPLIDEWSAEDKINLLGHSFGGVTVRLLAELMANGSEAEREASGSDVSDLFTGGKADWIYSVTALAAPHNGTTAYLVRDAIIKDVNATAEERAVVAMLTVATAPHLDRALSDSAEYDMDIDHALAINENISTLKNVYYFSYPCSATERNADGTYSPVDGNIDRLFRACAVRMGKFTCTTKGGYVVDEKWFENDGLVNKISALAPFNAPSAVYSGGEVATGIWNIMPTFSGDHLSINGGLFVNHNVRVFYVDLLSMINEL